MVGHLLQSIPPLAVYLIVGLMIMTESLEEDQDAGQAGTDAADAAEGCPAAPRRVAWRRRTMTVA